jgi:hypothetical protein
MGMSRPVERSIIRVETAVLRAVQLFEFFAHLGSSGGISDAGIDFAEKRHADAYGLETAMMDVGRNDVRSKLLAFSDLVHLFGDPAFARKVHLRRIPSAAVHHRCTLFDPSIPPSHKDLTFIRKFSGRRAVRVRASRRETNYTSRKMFSQFDKTPAACSPYAAAESSKEVNVTIPLTRPKPYAKTCLLFVKRLVRLADQSAKFDTNRDNSS